MFCAVPFSRTGAVQISAHPEMSEKNVKGEEQKRSETQRTGKKPYQKPSFRYEKVFETIALSCGKVHPTQFQCRFNRKNS